MHRIESCAYSPQSKLSLRPERSGEWEVVATSYVQRRPGEFNVCGCRTLTRVLNS
jgi:hypothetical protein